MKTMTRETAEAIVRAWNAYREANAALRRLTEPYEKLDSDRTTKVTVVTVVGRLYVVSSEAPYGFRHLKVEPAEDLR